MLNATLEAEERAITEEEEKRADEISAEIDRIDKTIEILNKMAEKMTERAEEEEEDTEERAEEEVFADFLRGTVTENRAANLTFGDNGAVVPKAIAQKIIKKVYDICPVLEKSTKYNVKGTLIDKKRNIAAISVMAAAKIPTWSAESFARMTVPTPAA